MKPDELAAAVERLRRDKAGEVVYDFHDDLYPYPDGEGEGTRWEVDCAIVTDAYLAREAELAAWTDPTPLTLDVLRRELGEPNGTTLGGSVAWGCQSPQYIATHDGVEVVRVNAATLGQLRRILSVIHETNGGE